MREDIHEYINAAIDDEGTSRRQTSDAAAIIAQFLVVKKGLEGRVSPHNIYETAAILTSAIWTKTK